MTTVARVSIAVALAARRTARRAIPTQTAAATARACSTGAETQAAPMTVFRTLKQRDHHPKDHHRSPRNLPDHRPTPTITPESRLR